MPEFHRNSFRNQQQSPPKPSLLDDNRRFLYIFFLVYLCMGYSQMMQIVRLKYTGEKGLFETHPRLMRTSLLSLLVAGITYMGLIFKLRPTLSKNLSRVVFKIASIVFLFSTFLAFITLWLVSVID